MDTGYKTSLTHTHDYSKFHFSSNATPSPTPIPSAASHPQMDEPATSPPASWAIAGLFSELMDSLERPLDHKLQIMPLSQ